MISSEAPPKRLNGRSGSRTNLFISATLYGDEGFCPAKVRNLSEYGALVEASILPPPGTAIRLCRGSLVVAGEVVWRRGGKAGLHFNSAIIIADWLPGGTCRDQSRVDEMVHQVRMGSVSESKSYIPQPSAATPAVSQELEAIASMIEQLAESFTTDTHVIANHSSKLQHLEVVVQRLRRIRID